MKKTDSSLDLNLENTALGIELGSTRIKVVLIGPDHVPLANGLYSWENQFKNGYWTYDLEEVWKGLQAAFLDLADDFRKKFGRSLEKVGSIGISAMMHGYLPFDKEGNQLAAFRTWRNTTTGQAAEQLSELFQFNIPHRWSIAHLYQAILNGEEHVGKIDFITTLAGYVHWKLTGVKVLGIGDASGMFPIDTKTLDYDESMVEKFQRLIEKYNFDWTLREILPKVLLAGEHAGVLTEEGARLLDPTGTLQPGIPFCPPEGDAGTGMVATNSVKERTGNVSAGTSIFSMIVLEHDLENYYKEIDIVTTPTGKPVAMVHCNNFTSDINAWAKLFAEVMELMGSEVDMDKLFTVLFQKAMEADPDNGKLMSCNYYAGEPITGFDEGRPLFVRMPDSKLNAANFMRTQIYSALATLKIGMDILTTNENVTVDFLLGHGGFFRTKDVGQQMMADALNIPVSVMETAGEGGPWGMAILAAYAINKEKGQTLEEYLDQVVFAKAKPYTIAPTKEGNETYNRFIEVYKKMLVIERAAIDALK